MADAVVKIEQQTISVDVGPFTPGQKGDPGGNIIAIGLFADGPSIAIPLGTNLVQTSGHSATGLGAARYYADLAVDAAYVSAHPRTSFISANGRGFRLDLALVTLDMFGADPTGSGDSKDAVIEAMATLAEIGGGDLHVAGHYRHTAQIIIPNSVYIVGSGALTSAPANRSPSTFIKDFNGTGFVFSGEDTGTDRVQYDCASGRSGWGVQVISTRWDCPSIAVSNHGGGNLWIGLHNAGPVSTNTNSWYIGYLRSYGSGGDGLFIEETNTSTGTTFPSGTPDVNAGTLLTGDISTNAGHGIHLGNGISCTIGSGRVNVHENTGYGVYLDNYAVGHRGTIYSELNTAGDLYADATTSRNVIEIGHDPALAPTVTDLAAPGMENYFKYFSTNFGPAPTNPRSGRYRYGKSLTLSDATASTAVATVEAFLNSTQDRVAIDFEVYGTSGTQASLSTKADGGAFAKRLTVGGGLARFYNLAQVLINKSVADTTTPGLTLFADTSARIDHVVGASSGTMAAFYTTSGAAGAITSTGTTTAYGTSSARDLKVDHGPLEDPYALIMAVEPRMCTFKVSGEEGRPEPMYFADELAEVQPSAVIFDEDGKPQSADYGRPSPIMWAAIRKLISDNQAMAARLAELEAK